MKNVINFEDCLAAKQEQDEMSRITVQFMDDIFPRLSYDDKVGILEAMENKDKEAFRRIIEPIVKDIAYRETMRKMNAR